MEGSGHDSRHFSVTVGGRPIRFERRWVFPHRSEETSWDAAQTKLGALILCIALIGLLLEGVMKFH